MRAELIHEACRHCWALEPTALAMLRSCLLSSDDDIAFDGPLAIRAGDVARRSGAVAVIRFHGALMDRASPLAELFGFASMERLGEALQQAIDDPGVKAIVGDFDSPGGTVFGTPELAERIRSQRDRKPLVAVANNYAASGGYYLASQFGELVVSPSGQVGSIGVYMLHVDESQLLERIGVTPTLISAGKYKVEGNPFEPLSDEAREEFQREVDGYYADFVRDVAKGRGVSAAKVKRDFGQGRMLRGSEAVAVGMADRTDTLEGTLARLGAGKRLRSASMERSRRKFLDGKRALDKISGCS